MISAADVGLLQELDAGMTVLAHQLSLHRLQQCFWMYHKVSCTNLCQIWTLCLGVYVCLDCMFTHAQRVTHKLL
jgi:hypothetical protein